MDAVSESERNVAQNIMQAVGDTLWVEQEAMIDAVTAVSGSGPAYVFYFIEAMQEAAQQLGFDAAQARQLALATFQGAAQLAQQSDESVSILRERVTSKGGTTYAALCRMDASEVKPAIHQAVLAAAQRGKELGDEFGQN
jgi:pyrroline-5-carboxylate reductase